MLAPEAESMTNTASDRDMHMEEGNEPEKQFEYSMSCERFTKLNSEESIVPDRAFNDKSIVLRGWST